MNNKISFDVLDKAIIEYRSEGMELMIRLGKKFGYDITVQQEYEELIWKSNIKVPRCGKLYEKINYSFHGGDCGFYKIKTQQTIEVKLTNPPKFGKIDAWFLKVFLDSTAEYKEISKNIDWQELKPMLEELYISGKIEKID
jgi:hypothetical protein